MYFYNTFTKQLYISAFITILCKYNDIFIKLTQKTISYFFVLLLFLSIMYDLINEQQPQNI